MLDEINVNREHAQSRDPSGTLDDRCSPSAGARQNGEFSEPEESTKQRRKGKGRQAQSEESEDQEDDLPVPKQKRSSVNESLFPWRHTANVLQETLPADLQTILALLEDWANDPTFVVRKILLSPGCPDFPPDQWANIVKGLAVNLDKVLGAHYSTEVNTKHSHDIGDLFQIAVKLPKQTKAIKSHGDWVIAFGKTIQATSFALPQRTSEYSAWLSYMSQLFASVRPTFHDCVIDFDKAVRLRAANQKHICLSDFAQFKDLQTIYLTSYSMGPNPPERTGGKVRRDPCHRWNRGTCDKSTSECKYQHCCDRRNCRGSH
ncbi:hypothetical protein PAXRUDRAFT_146119 [Paxillus rubicundulus Ve08.2h10]|uniref:C3H1-type domain-containing protein n=1 Tax=Paxillus rubicundulus Ve08.2h10 TaxID=930991 RepID=A0A0D0DMT4_9AGAM|nr:hypothetical protein PAXRUDRAFT_146119 [Paxillus rubicundulus Ve08.2h10]